MDLLCTHTKHSVHLTSLHVSLRSLPSRVVTVNLLQNPYSNESFISVSIISDSMYLDIIVTALKKIAHQYPKGTDA